MGKNVIISVQEDHETLLRWLFKTRHTRVQQRVKMLMALQSDTFDSQQAVADHIGVNISSVQRWIRTYRDLGIDGLCKSEKRDKASKLFTQDIMDWLTQILNESNAPVKGYKHLQVLIAEKFNKHIHYHALYYYIRTHFKTKLKSPRKSHGDKDQQAVDAFLKTP